MLGKRDGSVQRRNASGFTPFEAELTVFSSLEAKRLEHQLEAGPARHCPPRHGATCDSRNDGITMRWMTWRAISARP